MTRGLWNYHEYLPLNLDGEYVDVDRHMCLTEVGARIPDAADSVMGIMLVDIWNGRNC